MKKIITAVLFGLIPSICLGAVPDEVRVIEIFGGFDVFAGTFQRMALIMSDVVYNDLFFTAIVVSVLFLGCAIVFRSVFEDKAHMFTWVHLLGSLIIGFIIFKAFIEPRSNVLILDRSSNQMIEIPDVPDGVIFVAGLAKKIENGLIRIIETSNSPDSFFENPGGITFNIFANAFHGSVDMTGVGLTGGYLNLNIRQYFKDCVMFELSRVGTTLTIDDLHMNTDFMPIFAEGYHPSIYTLYFDPDNPTGVTHSCTSAWMLLENELNRLDDLSAANDKYWTERCLQAGYNHSVEDSIGFDMTRVCREKAANLLSSPRMLGTAVTSSQIMRQHLMASEMWNALMEVNPDVSVTVKSAMAMGNSLIGAGIAAHEWMPHMQMMMFAIYISFMPFFMILAATPFYSRVIPFMLGAFVFFVTWGVCDALLHSFATDKAIDVMRQVMNGQLGLSSFLLFKNDALKAYACFAPFRILSVMFAGIFAGVLTRMGGSMWTRVLTHPGSQIRAAGAGAAMEAIDPAKNAQRKDALVDAVPVQLMHNAHGFDEMTRAQYYGKETEFQTKDMAVKAFGGYLEAPAQAAGVMAEANLTHLREKVAHSDAVKKWGAAHGLSTDDTVRMSQDYVQHAGASTAMAMHKIAEQYDISAMEALDFAKHIQTETGFGNALGVERAFNAAEKDGFTGTIADYQSMRADIDSRKGFLNAETTQQMAETYFGGDTSRFLRHEAEWSQARTAGLLQAFAKNQAEPVTVGEAIGRANAIESLAKQEHLFSAGDEVFYKTQSGQLYEAAARQLKRSAMEEIAKTGGISEDSRKGITALLASETGSAQLRAQGGMETTVRSRSEAGQFSRYLQEQGAQVDKEDLIGAKVNLNMYTDTDGELHTGFVAVRRGTVVTSEDYREFKGELGKAEAEKLGMSLEGFYTIRTSADGANALFVHGESGRMFTKSNMAVERDSKNGYRVAYKNPETGETGYAQLSQGTESRDVASHVRHLRKNETVTFKDGSGELKLIAGEIRTKGVMQEVDGVLENGRHVGFRYNTVTHEVTDRSISQDVNFKPDEVYRNLYDKSDGDMIEFYDLNDKTIRIAFVNNLAQTVGNIIKVDAVRTLTSQGGIGGKVGKSGVGLAGSMGINQLNSNKVDRIASSFLNIIEESEDKIEGVNYEKAEDLLKNECDGLIKTSLKAGHIGITSEGHKGKAAQDHYKEKFEDVFDRVMPNSMQRNIKNPESS